MIWLIKKLIKDKELLSSFEMIIMEGGKDGLQIGSRESNDREGG